MKLNKIFLSDLENDKRFDAEFFSPEFVKATLIISKMNHLKLGEETLVVDGPFGSSIHAEDYVEQGVPFLQVHNITEEGRLNLSTVAHISEDDHQRLKSSEALPGDVLITKTGWVGFATVLPEDIIKANYRADLAKIRIKDKKELDPYFLSSFLNSKFGRLQTRRLQSGSRGDRILAKNIKKLIIPKLTKPLQKKIRMFYVSSIEKIKRSQMMYQEAQQILLEELNLKDYKPKHEISFYANLKDILMFKRIDPEYYQPKYKIVEEKIKNVKHETLGKLFDLTKGFEVGGYAYQEKGIPYLRVSNLEVLELNWGYPKFISKDLFNQLNENYQPQKGEILLSKDGTPGIAYLVRDNIKSINSSGILRLKLKDTKKLNLSYMTLVLNSILIQQQINRDSGGAIIKHWRPEEVKNTLVPILDDPIQEKIASKLDESYKLRKESKELLEKAKKMVEDEVEKEAEK